MFTPHQAPKTILFGEPPQWGYIFKDYFIQTTTVSIGLLFIYVLKKIDSDQSRIALLNHFFSLELYSNNSTYGYFRCCLEQNVKTFKATRILRRSPLTNPTRNMLQML